MLFELFGWMAENYARGFAVFEYITLRAVLACATALIIALAATLIGGSNVQPAETRDWGIFFGLDFFVVNLLITGFMFAPLERAFPHRRKQRLFRTEWREDLFYYLVSTMFVQVLGFLALAPSTISRIVTRFWMPRPDPIGAPSGMIATAPTSSSRFAAIGSSTQ